MISAQAVKELRELTGAGILDCKKALEATDGDIQKAIDWLREKGVASAAKKSGRIAAEGLTAVRTDGNRAVIVELNSETDFVAKNELFLALMGNVAQAILENNPADLDAANELLIDGVSIADSVINATATIGEKITFRRFVVVEKTDDQTFGEYVHMGGTISAVAVVKGDAALAKDIAMQVASMAPVYVSQAEIPAEIVTRETEIQQEIVKNDPEMASKPEKVIEGIIKGRVSKSMQDLSLVDQVYFKDGKAKVGQVLKDNNAEVASFVRFAVGEGIEKKQENFAEEVAKAAQGQ